MAAGETGPQAPKPKPGNQPSSNIWFWWLILVGLAAWNVVALWPHGPELAAIPYSTFLDQLRAGNVSQVHIIGDRITGTFAKPLLWPKPTQSGHSKAEPRPRRRRKPGQRGTAASGNAAYATASHQIQRLPHDLSGGSRRPRPDATAGGSQSGSGGLAGIRAVVP